MTENIPPFDDPQKRQEWAVVDHVVQILNRRHGHDLHLDSAPDLPGRPLTGQGKLVDFVYRDRLADDRTWNIEVKRLVPQHVRQQEGFTREKIKCLRDTLPGTYAAELRIDSSDRKGRVNEENLKQAVDQILADAHRGHVKNEYVNSPECALRKIRTDGSIALPWLWDYDPDIPSPRHRHVPDLLAQDFAQRLADAREQFDGSPAARNLLVIETRGSLIDRLIHLGVSADGPGAMHQWMATNSKGWTERDLVVVDPHVWVGQFTDDPNGRRMRTFLTGTKYADDEPYTALGNPWRLWPEPGGPI